MINRLRTLIKEAMIEKKETGNHIKYSVYKNILDKAQKDAKDKHLENNISDEIVVNAAKKELKQLNDTLPYIKDETSDRFVEVTESIKIVEEFLPKQASDEEIKTFLIESNAEKNMGKCMKVLKEKFGSNFDGKKASAIVKEYISC